MEFVKEQKDSLNAIVKIKVTPSDYTERVETQMRKIQRTATMPGFRAGKIPSGMLRKMYGKSVLVDELNKLLQDSLYSYLQEQSIEFLGNPLPLEKGDEGNWDNPSDFEFSYELGLTPSINLQNVAEETVPYYKIKVGEEQIETRIADIRRRYGKFSNPEKSSATDILYGDLVELNADLTEKEGGIRRPATLSVELIAEAERAKFVDVDNTARIVFNPAKALEHITDRAAALGVDKEMAATITSDFRYDVSTINSIQKAELDQELFDKVFGEGEVTSEADMRQRLSDELSGSYDRYSDMQLRNDMAKLLLSKLNISLPDEFLKRWILRTNEKPISEEQLINEYDGYAKDLRWQLIENEVFKVQRFSIEPEELKAYFRSSIVNMFAQYGQPADEGFIEKMTADYMKKEDQVRRAVSSVSAQKVFEYLKSTISLDIKEVSMDEFDVLASV